MESYLFKKIKELKILRRFYIVIFQSSSVIVRLIPVFFILFFLLGLMMILIGFSLFFSLMVNKNEILSFLVLLVFIVLGSGLIYVANKDFKNSVLIN
jgi:hypothetical protein